MDTDNRALAWPKLSQNLACFPRRHQHRLSPQAVQQTSNHPSAPKLPTPKYRIPASNQGIQAQSDNVRRHHQGARDHWGRRRHALINNCDTRPEPEPQPAPGPARLTKLLWPFVQRICSSSQGGRHTDSCADLAASVKFSLFLPGSAN